MIDKRTFIGAFMKKMLLFNIDFKSM